MARPLRLAVADGIYHVTARGNNRAPIFEDDRDRRTLLAILAHAVGRFDWRCLSFCLMGNHFHLLVRTPMPNLPRGMRCIKGGYAQAFNRRHDRVGHLFAERYKARLVQQDAHLLTVFAYIARNPVAAGICARPEAWPWSAHAALAGETSAPGFLAVDEALAWFAPEANVGRARYRALVVDAPELPELPAAAAVGKPEFLREVLPPRSPGPEIPVREWGEGRPPLDELLEADDRNAAIARAYREHGYTLGAIAGALGCHVSTVSRRLRRHERAGARMQDLTP